MVDGTKKDKDLEEKKAKEVEAEEKKEEKTKKPKPRKKTSIHARPIHYMLPYRHVGPHYIALETDEEDPKDLLLKQAEEDTRALPEVEIEDLVSHKVFGEGRVANIEDDRVVVVFGRAKKTFNYPAAFYDGFLKIEKEPQA